jgi:hypothetical protein
VPGVPPDPLAELLAFAGGFLLAVVAVAAIVWRARAEARRRAEGSAGEHDRYSDPP